MWSQILDVKEPKLNLSSVDQEVMKTDSKEKIYNKTILQVSEVELKKHKDFLKSDLKKNFY